MGNYSNQYYYLNKEKLFLTYCQSKERVNNPNPSLFVAPPNYEKALLVYSVQVRCEKIRAYQVCEHTCLAASSMHRGEAGDGNRVEPWKNVGREKLIEKHASKSIPEVSKRLGIFNFLPMKSLESFNGRKSSPVDCFRVPNSNWAHNTSDTVAKQPN